MSKQPTKAQRERFSKLADYGCVVCVKFFNYQTPGEIHHLRTGQGLSQRDHSLSICLCYGHHRGEQGYHHLGKKVFEERFGTELELLDYTNKLIS